MAGELVVVGLSHHTAPISLRERLAVSSDRLPEELHRVMAAGAGAEGVLISTCNRVELYAATQDPAATTQAARRYLNERAAPDTVDDYLYERWGEDAVCHAFRVTSSLDSMVLGEPQILGQVKEAYEAAAAAGTVGTLLGRCFTHAFAVAKRVRTETGVAEGSVSVSSIACDLARKIFADMRRRHVLLVGAGKMGESAARNLRKSGARLLVVNRSAERAEQLAHACDGEPRGYEMLAQELVKADIVITSTGSDRFVISHELMRDVMRARRHRPLFLIDIAVPRDIDPRVGDRDEVFLYDVDDLQHVANENIAARRREAQAAERIVRAEVEDFERWKRSLALTPTIVALRERFRRVVREELERTMPKLRGLDDKDRHRIDKMCDAIVNKLLHAPLTQLREGTEQPDGAKLIDAAQQLFELEAEAGQREASEQTEPEPDEQVVGKLATAGHRSGDSS